MAGRVSWLCPTEDDRHRFLDMQSRLRLARAITITSCSAVAASLVPRAGWVIVAIVGALAITTLLSTVWLDRRERPELWVFVWTVLSIQLMFSAVTLVTGGPRTSMSCLLAAPVLMVGARFSTRGLLIGAPISVVLVLAVTLGADPAYVVAHPDSVMVPLALVLISAVYLGPLVASEMRHRSDSTLDALTGLLNRRTLEDRVSELVAQAGQSCQPVSAVAFDVDQFKAINDQYGHGAGDAVLRDIAHQLRTHLRSFELLYRVGGDEFVLLLPGTAQHKAALIAEEMRTAIGAARPHGLTVTCSFGVAGTQPQELANATLLEQADRALYVAKHAGRNRVENHPLTQVRHGAYRHALAAESHTDAGEIDADELPSRPARLGAS